MQNCHVVVTRGAERSDNYIRRNVRKYGEGRITHADHNTPPMRLGTSAMSLDKITCICPAFILKSQSTTILVISTRHAMITRVLPQRPYNQQTQGSSMRVRCPTTPRCNQNSTCPIPGESRGSPVLVSVISGFVQRSTRHQNTTRCSQLLATTTFSPPVH